MSTEPAVTAPARKGDLLIVEVTNRVTWLGKPTITTTTYRIGVVASATRDGIVKTWVEAGYTYTQPIRDNRCWVVPAKNVDTVAALIISVDKDYDSLADVKDAISAFRKVTL